MLLDTREMISVLKPTKISLGQPGLPTSVARP